MATTTLPQTQSEAAAVVPPGTVFRAAAPAVTYRQRFTHAEANLKFLGCGEYHLPAGAESQSLQVPGCELLLYMWKGRASAEIGTDTYHLAPYDTLYVPLGSAFLLRNEAGEDACVIQTSAPAQNVHPVYHSRFEIFSK